MHIVIYPLNSRLLRLEKFVGAALVFTVALCAVVGCESLLKI